MNLRNVDLNLLVVFDALIREQSVSRAASRLGLTQPAVSNALSRLRDLFRDPLFVRGGRKIEPTPRCLALAEPIARLLEELDKTISQETDFDPKTSEREFRIASTDYGALIFGSRLVREFCKRGASVRLDILPLRDLTPATQLAEGKFDLAIGFRFEDRPGIRKELLYHENWVCTVRKDHPLVKKKLPMDLFLRLRHIVVAPWGTSGAVVDNKLSTMGLKRRVGIRVPTFLVAPVIVAQTDYISTTPLRVAKEVSKYLPLKMLPPPVALDDFPIAIAWHERTHSDPAHRWLRNVITEIAHE